MSHKRGIIVTSTIALFAVLALAGCSSPAPASSPSASTKSTATGMLKDIETAGVIRVGMPADPPFALQDANGNFSSFNPELVKLMGKDLGVKVVFVNTSFAAVVAGLQSGQYDMIGTSISATPERKQAIDFTTPYAYGGNTWIVPKSSKYKTIDDLNSPDVTIAFNASTFQGTATTAHMPKAQTRSLVNVSYADLISEVVSQRSNAVSVPSFIAPAITDKYPSLKAIPAGNKGVDATGVAWGILKDQPSLKAYLNGFLKKETKNGTIDKLYKKYITLANALK